MSNYFRFFADEGSKLNELLEFIYEDRAPEAKRFLSVTIKKHLPDLEKLKTAYDKPKKAISAKDALLITYGDMISEKPEKTDSSGKPEVGRSTLNKLSSFLDRHIRGFFLLYIYCRFILILLMTVFLSWITGLLTPNLAHGKT